MVNAIVRDLILAALPHHDGRTVMMPEADMVNVVIVNGVVAIHEILADFIADQRNPCSPKIGYLTVFDADALRA